MSVVMYKTRFTDVLGNHYKVEILNEDFKGQVKEMDLGPDAVTLSRPAKKITEPLFSMGITIQALCNENFEYAGLFTTREQTHEVILYRNDKEIFHGWVEPEMYEEEFITPPYYINIPATDGLAALENYYPAELRGTGLISLLDVIRACLNCTGMLLPINIACSLNPDDRTDNRLFEHCYVEKEALRTFKEGIYEYDNAKQLLEDILLSFSCRCYQSGNEWYIERIKDKTASEVEWVRYPYDGAVTVLKKKDTISLDTPDYMFVNSAATLQVDSGYGRQTVKADGSVWDTVIANNFSDGIQDMPVVVYPDNTFAGSHRVWYKNTMSKVEMLPYTDLEFEQGVRIKHNTETTEYDRIWQHTKIRACPEDEINISFKITLEPGRISAEDKQYKIGIHSRVRDRNGSTSPNLKWVKDKADETIYTTTIDLNEASYAVYIKDNDWKDGFSVPLDISITGKIKNLHSSFDFTDLSFAILPIQAKSGEKSWTSSSDYVRATIVGDIKVSVKEKRKYDNTFTATINRNYMREADSLDIRFWTLPSKYDYSDASNYNFRNGLFDKNYGGIQYISCKGESIRPLSVPERLLVDNFDQYYDPRDLLSGEVMTRYLISPEQRFTVATREKKVDPPPAPDAPKPEEKTYLLVGLEAALRDAVFDTNIEEIKPHQINIG